MSMTITESPASMIYFTGVSNEHTRAAGRNDLGLLGTPDGSTWRQRDDYAAGWAADNGCFKELTKPGSFDTATWLNWLRKVGTEGCAWATLPDVVGDAVATWERSRRYVHTVRCMGFPVAIVLQNGLESEPEIFEQILNAADAVFVGGSPECVPCGYVRPGAEFARKVCPFCERKLTEWKLGEAAARLVAAAKARGLWVHMGRVNSYKRIAYAASIGCDSSDGTYLNFGKKADRLINTLKVFGWLDRVNHRND